MKFIKMNVLLASTLSVLPLLANAAENVPSQDIQEARSLIKTFGGDLKHVLKTSMKSGGPINALEACNIQAGPIAKSNSSLSNWNIGRTSLKVRNENNAPDKWEFATLQQFEKRKASGEDVKTMDYSEIIRDGDKVVYRYMKPIPTAGLCVTCHGGDVPDKITNKIKSLYPNDQATGFSAGDIRGAFTLTKSIK